MITEEEFEAWKDNPVTQWVLSACRKAAEENKQAWIEASWEGGQCNPLELIELKTRADAYLALEQTQFEGWKATHGESE